MRYVLISNSIFRCRPPWHLTQFGVRCQAICRATAARAARNHPVSGAGTGIIAPSASAPSGSSRCYRDRTGRACGPTAAGPSGRLPSARCPHRSVRRPQRRPGNALRCAPGSTPPPPRGTAASVRARAGLGRWPQRRRTPMPRDRTGTTWKPASARSARPGPRHRPGPAAGGTRPTSPPGSPARTLHRWPPFPAPRHARPPRHAEAGRDGEPEAGVIGGVRESAKRLVE